MKINYFRALIYSSIAAYAIYAWNIDTSRFCDHPPLSYKGKIDSLKISGGEMEYKLSYYD